MEKTVERNTKIQLTDKEIFTKIWTKPRQVLKFINENHYDKFLYVLLFFAGVSRSLNSVNHKQYGDDVSSLKVLTLLIIIGGLLGWIYYYIYSALISWTGEWLNGKGDTKSILRVIAYAMIPAIIGLIMIIPQLAIYGNEIFKENGDTISAGLISNIIFYSSQIIQGILGIFSLVFIVTGISEVQKLSIGNSILNLLLPLFVLGLPVLIIVLIIELI
ncbi:MAG: YIP1 family protein [Bizionia sp.]|nr:YIP1 family protein [Bizionia sp.]